MGQMVTSLRPSSRGNRRSRTVSPRFCNGVFARTVALIHPEGHAVILITDEERDGGIPSQSNSIER
jgi:hypothetical protein